MDFCLKKRVKLSDLSVKTILSSGSVPKAEDAPSIEQNSLTQDFKLSLRYSE